MIAATPKSPVFLQGVYKHKFTLCWSIMTSAVTFCCYLFPHNTYSTSGGAYNCVLQLLISWRNAVYVWLSLLSLTIYGYLNSPDHNVYHMRRKVRAVICWITMPKKAMLFGMLETDDGDNTILRNVRNALSNYTL